MMRIEKDSLGELEVPEDAYYGIQSTRSKSNFDVAGERLPLALVYGIVRLKWACALANHELGLLESKKCKAIETACKRVLSKEFDQQFVVDIFQAGSGTSSNMNINEVLANIACEELGGKRGDRTLVHPNDDVNKGQSTNNVFPSGIKVSAVLSVDELIASVDKLIQVFEGKATAFTEVLKSGRTHLQDAVPITLGQSFNAYAQALKKDSRRILEAKEKILELGIGGNAVGTGVNTPSEFRVAIINQLKKLTKAPFFVAEDGLEVTQFLTDLAQFSGSLKLLAMDIQKICNDLRLLVSGPNTGLNEIVLPAVEPGSSIMPGKINPSICEAANMACIQVMGYDHAVSLACAAGQLELNTHMPVVGTNIMKSLQVLTRCACMLAEKCVGGITANKEVCYAYFERSGGLGTILNPKLGYDAVAVLVKESLKEGKTMKELVLEKEIMSMEEFEALEKNSTGPKS